MAPSTPLGGFGGGGSGHLGSTYPYTIPKSDLEGTPLRAVGTHAITPDTWYFDVVVRFRRGLNTGGGPGHTIGKELIWGELQALNNVIDKRH